MMRYLFVFLLALGGTSSAWAETSLGGVVGVNLTEWDGDNVSYDPEVGFEAGLTAIVPFQGRVALRTGAAYVQKKTSADQTGGKFKGQFDYIEVPITALYSLNDATGIFGGANLDLKVADDCELGGASCTMEKDESFVYNLVVGGRFDVAKPSAIEAFYELGIADIAKDNKIGSSIGLRYVYMFQ